MEFRHYSKTLHKIVQNRIPEQLIIQFTDHCNARCPQCGMRVTSRFERKTLKMEDMRKILDKASQKGVQVVSFTGGEPFLFPEALYEMIRYAGSLGINYIRTGTNGFIFMNPQKADFTKRMHAIASSLAKTALRNMWISIDSADPETHEKMRGLPGVIAGIEKALPIFHEYGIYPAANLGINRNAGGTAGLPVPFLAESGDKEAKEAFFSCYKDAFSRFYRFVTDIGFTAVNCCYPMSMESQFLENHHLNPVYAAQSADLVVRFGKQEKALLYRALFETIPAFRSRVRIFSPRVSLYALSSCYSGENGSLSYPCRGGKDFFFVDSRDGNTYPCGYRGDENLGRYWDMQENNNGNQECRMCDWECFRDPSELFGPVLEGIHAPVSLIRKIRKDKTYFRIWTEDIRYYKACGFFHGREKPDYEKLKQFQVQGSPANTNPAQ